MKTSLTIVLNYCVDVQRNLEPRTHGATADYSGKTPGRCGVVPCPSQQQAQRTSWPTPSTSYRGVR